MPSPEEIVNHALDMLDSSPINDLAATDAKSQKCARIYNIVRRIMLEKDDWLFAKSRISVAFDATEPINEWTYAYTLPADCIKPKRINDDDTISWEVEGQKILTNQTPPIILEYIKDITNPNVWSSGFTEALTAYLASRYAKAFPQDNDKAQREYGEYKESLGEATAKNGQVGSVHRPAVTGFTGGRRY